MELLLHKWSGQPFKYSQNVAPGQTIDLSVTLIAPKDPLTYQGFCRLKMPKAAFWSDDLVAVTTLADQDNPVATGQPSGNYCTVTVAAPKNSVKKALSNFNTVWEVKYQWI